MSQPKVPLKDPIFAAILAFLVPGLGHLYQGRIFKGVLYAGCILGTFFAGMQIGYGQVVYFNWQPTENRTYAYFCQFWVGLPAIPALAQAKLRSSQAFDANYIPKHFQAPFEGELSGSDRFNGILKGTIDIQPQQPDTPRLWGGQLTGTLTTSTGEIPVKGQVTPGSIEAAVAPSRKRRLYGTFEGQVAGDAATLIQARLEGHVPRSLWNSYEAPLQDTRANEFAGEPTELDRAHFELGSRFELGVVFTMIAGLLNVLAIYDALDGPAYGDDEEEETEKKPPPVATT
jgi:hypothetical protein